MKKITKSQYLEKQRRREALHTKKKKHPTKAGVFESSGRIGSMSCFKSTWKKEEEEEPTDG